jgi:hypothetical protein
MRLSALLFFSFGILVSFCHFSGLSSAYGSSTHDFNYLQSFKNYWSRKKIHEIIQRNWSPLALKKKAHHLLDWNQQEKEGEWWSYSTFHQECFNTQIELQEYLRFLQAEKKSISVHEDQKRKFFQVTEKSTDLWHTSFWTKDRYDCELNKEYFSFLISRKGK